MKVDEKNGQTVTNNIKVKSEQKYIFFWNQPKFVGGKPLTVVKSLYPLLKEDKKVW
jgi:hypothetical protein